MSGIEHKLAGLSAEQRAFVELQLQRSNAARAQPSIPRRADGEPPALSFAQQRLWLMSELDPGNPAYVMPGAARLTGPLNLPALERALNAIVDRHETLRTTFVLAGEQPQQIIQTDPRVALDVIDLRGLPADGREAEARRIAIRKSREPFDLAMGPLLRASILQLGTDDHVLILTAHHIVSDGWSMAIFINELGELYRAFDAGQPSSLAPLPVQYADFAVWQRGWLQGTRLDAQLEYWKGNLAGASALQLPLDRPRPAVPGSDGALEMLTLAPGVLAGLKALSQAEGATLFMTLLAGFDVLLARYSGQDDITVGTPIANRTRAEIEGLIGCFVNALVMRTDLSGDPTVRALLARVRETSLAAFAHQDLPFERLVDELQPERSVGQNPLFQVMFALQNAPSAALDLGRVVLSPFDLPLTTARFDLEMHASERPEGLILRAVYRADLFEPATMRRLLRHFAALLEGMAAAPDRRISELSMIGSDERAELLALNPAPTPYPRDESIPALFEAQASRTPSAAAVDYLGDTLTYAQLASAANQIARRLQAAGVGRGTLVGVLAERTPQMIAGLLGILKAGGAYVPLDPSYPADRLQFMIQDAALRVVLYHEHLLTVVPEDVRGTLTLLPLERQTAGADEPMTAVAVGADDLAYVIYTSGSTGIPKGVAVTHAAVARLVCNTNYIDILATDRIAQASSSSFDAATFEIWGALFHGATIVGIEKEAALSSSGLSRAIADRGVTILFLTTALFNQIVRENPRAFARLRYVLFGGEAVDAQAVATVMTSGAPERLLHVYGPTESTTYASWYRVPRAPAAGGAVPIGRALANSTLYVLDRQLEPVPLGVIGELYIGGDGLARGYLNRSELTAERFVPNPFGDRGARLYRTGDLVRWTADGQIEFVGRNDGQVKIRGFRVELGEIETMLRKHPGVKDVVVVARDEDSDRRLVAYVVPAGDAPGWEALRAFLRERLPDYMVPSAFVALDKLPLNRNGKIDRRALPAPASERQLQQELVLPRTDLERRIAEAWRMVLQVPEVGISDNFFDLGGHSLRLLQLHGLLVKALEREIPVVDLFRFPTIGSLAAHLGDGSSAINARARASGRRRRIAAAEREPIAIIGMAGRFPGAADVETFWQNLRNGVESIGHFTDDELRAAGVAEELIANPRFVGSFGSIAGFDLFDAPFFGYSAREAALMDPQQRHMLECAWEALERAGYDPHDYKGLIGIYAGASANMYLFSLLTQVGYAWANTMAMFIGNVGDSLPTRVSYKLNLRGPSVNVQTACSTSLVAVHHACQSLLNGECDMALAGGANIKLSAASGYIYEDEGILSPDGHCRSFDAKARGTVGGSGVGMVVLKLLADAIADGDRIHAVIRGTAINNDGSDKVGFTAPGVSGQAAVVAAAQAAANVDPRSIGFVEAHGTGTLLGDPIEVEALAQAFGPRVDKATCALGSVKSNIGHLDAAAGAAGLIKATLALEHREIPPSLHFETPNPKMRLDETPFYVSDRLHDWPAGPTPRRAGVSAFGIGGTNVHIVLEEAPAQEPSGPSRPAQLILLSARTRAALDRATDNLAVRLDGAPDLSLPDIAFTLQVGRRRFKHRRMVVADSVADLRAALRDRDPKRVVSVDLAANSTPVAFVFPGQGAQAVDMGRGLYDTEPVFRAAVDRCADVLRHELSGDLRDVLYPSGEHAQTAADKMVQTAWSQPAIFVVEYALAQLWQSWGVTPHAMLGHSLGEYVAACVAGVFTLEDALALVAARGRMMQSLPPGAMVAVPLDEAQVRPLLVDGLSIASINGPSATVVSGPFEAIEAFERAAAAAGITTRRLVTSHAFHSAMLDPILGDFEALVRRLRPQPPTGRFISNVTGTWITASEATDPAYWVTHLRGTVRFGDGLATLLEDGKSIPLEVGPGQGLTSLARRLVTGSGREAVATLASRTGGRSADARDVVMALGRLWLAGVTIDWAGFHSHEQRRRLTLPTYPFERQRYWVTPERAAQPAAAAAKPSVPALTKRTDIDSWLYSSSWKPAPLPVDGSANALHQSFALVLADRDTIGDELARRLPNAALVRRGDRFEILGDREYAVDPGRREDFDAVLKELQKLDRFPAHVVHAWEATPGDGERAFESLLSLSQALAATGGDRSVDAMVLASGLHAVTAKERLAPRKALMSGLARVVSLEHPNLRMRTADVPLEETAAARSLLLDHVVREMASGSGDPSVAYRGLDRYVEAFDAVAPAVHAERPAALRERGVYLITGGLGAIGLTIAEHLMSAVRARVVLVGRSEPPPRNEWDALLTSPETPAWQRVRIERLKHLESLDGEVMVVRADASSLENLREAIARTEQRFGDLNGVIHGAVLGGADVLHTVGALTMANSRKQFAPKVDATIALEQALGDRQLDFCLLMSSLSAIVGGLEFGAYAASNAYLDAFAHEHNRRGAVPWISVNWDNWTMNDSKAAASGPAALALAMTHTEGMQALDRVLRMPAAGRVVVSTADLAARVSRHFNRPPAAADARAAQSATRGGTTSGDTRRPFSEWFYSPSWKRSVAPVPMPVPPGGTPWLIFADDEGFGDELARRAELAGRAAVMVRSRKQYERRTNAEFSIDPVSREDYGRLFAEMAAGPGLPSRIVHCWSVPVAPEPSDAADSPGFLSLLHLAQALSGQTFEGPLPLHVVTSRVHEVTGLESLAPQHALVTGAINVLPHEDPRIACVHMDLDEGWPAATEAQWRTLMAELHGEVKDRVVAYRAGHRWVQTFEPLALPAAAAGAPSPIRDRGVYLITGGLGGIGLAIARHLAETAGARLVLTSRRAVPERSQWAAYLSRTDASDRTARDIRALQELEALGATVMVAAADVCDEPQMRRVVAGAVDRFGALHGVVHSAGVAGGGLIQLKDRDTAARVLAPKTLGTRTLAHVVNGQALDFFVLCSSLTSIIGGPGQVDYCAANAYQDAFAREHAKRTGVRTIAINWDSWREVGMAVETAIPEALRAGRQRDLKDGKTSAEGVEIFLRALSRTDVTQIAVSTKSLEPRMRTPATAAPSAEAPSPAATDAPESKAEVTYDRPELSQSYVAPRNPIEEEIAIVWQRLFGLSQVGVDDDFFELGGHSLLALQVMSRLREQFNVTVPLSVLFDAPTVAGLSLAVMEKMMEAEQAAVPPAS
jgi:amino acid adenylation domain-containing protein